MSEFRLGQWTVLPSTHQISSESITIQLRPLQMQLLCLLVEHQGITLSRDTIFEQIWPGRFGADEALSRTMSELRKALGDSVEIKTIPKTGYCLLTCINTTSPPAEVDQKVNNVGGTNQNRVKKPKWKIAIALSLISILAISFFYLNPKPQSVHDSVSVAILPLENFTDSTRTGLLADGLVEEITHQLARNPKISVASRTSAFYFRDSPIPVMDIGKKLSVSHVLEGSIRLTAKGYRITAQLIETLTGFHLWSKTFDSDENGLLGVQEQIAGEVRKLVGQSLAPQKTELSNELYETYLLGVEAIAEFGPDNLQTGEANFKAVLAGNPNFTPAKIGLATAIIAQINWGQTNEEIGFLTAENILNEVQVTGELTADYFLARAMLYSPKAIARKNTDREIAREWFDKALNQDPNNSKVLQFYARMVPKSNEQAIELLEKALKLDPYNPLIKVDMVNRQVPWSQKDLRIKSGKELIDQFPDSVYGYYMTGDAYDSLNNFVQSYVYSYRCIQEKPQFMNCWTLLIEPLVVAELYEQADEAMDLAKQYAPSLVSDFSIMKKAIKGDALAISQLMQEINLERLNPVLSHSALLWATSQVNLENLNEKQIAFTKKISDGPNWHQQLYRYHWLRFKEKDVSYKNKMPELIDEIKLHIETHGNSHRWLLAALAMNDQIDEAFAFAETIPSNYSITKFFWNKHQSIADPFLQPLHDDPRWEQWVAKHAATQKVIRDEILTIQKDLPLSGLKF